ncbi:MAG: NB-ARC domain-containing protein [Caldilineaceae bacterium]
MISIDNIDSELRRLLRNWKRPTIDPGELVQLSAFAQASELDQETAKRWLRRFLADAIEQLRHVDGESAQILQLRFVDAVTPSEAARKCKLTDSDYFRKQSHAVHALAEYLYETENKIYAGKRFRFEQRLIAPVHKSLFGIEDSLLTLRRLLAPGEEPWIVVIEGIGGIGKTALADVLVRRLISTENWDGVAWVSAAPSRMDMHGQMRPAAPTTRTAEMLLFQLYEQLLPNQPRPNSFSEENVVLPLIQLLKQSTCLVVLDNLEAIEDMERLLPLLRRMMNPSKFILTSRTSLYTESELAHFAVPELKAESALRLIRREAGVRQSLHLITASDSELLPIYDIVGGNPLALHLIAGQLHVHPLSTVLDDLRQARGKSVENLYSYIYSNAWKSLDDNARKVLLFMPLASELGGEIEHIVDATQMDRGVIRTSLDQLILLNLVQGRPDVGSYTIHSLTRTFLLEQVIRWQEK